MKVYLLEHSYKYEIWEDIKVDEIKTIGIYHSEEKAKEVVEHFKTKQGFNRFPEDCFYISELEVDQDHWTEGFITWDNETESWIE